MRKYIFLFLLVLKFGMSNGQSIYSYHFEKLAVEDTIFKSAQISELQRIQKSNDFLYTKTTYTDEAVYLVVKEKNYWLSFSIDIENKMLGSIIVSPNNRYLFIEKTYDHVARQTETVNATFVIVDLKNKTSFELEYFNSTNFWETEENSEFPTSKKDFTYSHIILENEGLTVVNTCSNNGEKSPCSDAGGYYKFSDAALIKTAYYDTKTLQMKPVVYIGEMAIGMTVGQLQSIYPHIDFIEKENPYEDNCAEENKFGFEVWDKKELLGFVTNRLSDNKMSGFIVVSDRFSFGGINTETSVESVLKQYPKANIRLDLMSGWEHIYIRELDIELVFKTDDNNRIGIYKNEDFVKIKNKKATADFITMQ